MTTGEPPDQSEVDESPDPSELDEFVVEIDETIDLSLEDLDEVGIDATDELLILRPVDADEPADSDE